MPQVKPEIETFAKIKVLGVGGGGNAAVDRMVKSGIRGVEFIVANTDIQALQNNSAPKKIHIGKTVTRGLGAGMDPEIGRRSAEESQNEIRDVLKGTDMLFITCGLGGGTGSGASPLIAQIAKEMGILTVAVVTKPFTFEGPKRKEVADMSHRELSQNVDTIITIPNDKVLQIIDKKTSLLDSFKIVDDVLRQGVQGVSELITVPGLVNVDFADVKRIMSDTGSALMGIGVASGEDRAAKAAKAAISSPLLELSIDGAKGVLISITGNKNLGMQEVAEASNIITESADDDVTVIFGTTIDENIGDEIRITVIATGFDERMREQAKVNSLRTEALLERKQRLEEQKNEEVELKVDTKRTFNAFGSSIFNTQNNNSASQSNKLNTEQKSTVNNEFDSRFKKIDLNNFDNELNKDNKTDNIINADDLDELDIPPFLRGKLGGLDK